MILKQNIQKVIYNQIWYLFRMMNFLVNKILTLLSKNIHSFFFWSSVFSGVTNVAYLSNFDSSLTSSLTSFLFGSSNYGWSNISDSDVGGSSFFLEANNSF